MVFNDKMITIYNVCFDPKNEVAIDNNEIYDKQIVELLKNGDYSNESPHFLQEKSLMYGNFIQQTPYSGAIAIVYARQINKN